MHAAELPDTLEAVFRPVYELTKIKFFPFLKIMDVPFPCISNLSADNPDQRRSVKPMRYKKGQGHKSLTLV